MKQNMKQLKTIWTDKVGNNPLPEYPRPQFVRDSFLNLNGLWQYAFTTSKDFPLGFDGEILVPFSPETILSGVNRQLKPTEFLHYKRDFVLTKSFLKDVLILHFGAVDSVARVYINGHFAGGHIGGYNSFSLDISKLAKVGTNTINVVVSDPTDSSFYTFGKQSTKRGGMWYTPQSGIWQTVWLESMNKQYIASAKLTPDFDNAKLHISLNKHSKNQEEFSVSAIVSYFNKQIAVVDSTENEFSIDMPTDFLAWSPEQPSLYQLQLVSQFDKVSSYFGMRKFSTGVDENGNAVTMLNNKLYFFNGLLDQGYWPDGLYTAPTDEALIYDIQLAKELGYNTLRKHIKVEPMRWYYHCDRLGMAVWQDMPSGGEKQRKFWTLYLPHLFIKRRNVKDSKYKRFSRAELASREMFMFEYNEMIDQLYNCTSIAVWVPFNEGWGQFDSVKVADFTKQKDPSRLVDATSGWHDNGGGEFKSLHIYFRKTKLDKKKKLKPVALTEFGGYSLPVENHTFCQKVYGYKKFYEKVKFEDALVALYERDVVANLKKGLCSAIYTQLSDVEDEINGLVTFDRKVVKVDGEKIRHLTGNLFEKEE